MLSNHLRLAFVCIVVMSSIVHGWIKCMQTAHTKMTLLSIIYTSTCMPAEWQRTSLSLLLFIVFLCIITLLLLSSLLAGHPWHTRATKCLFKTPYPNYNIYISPRMGGWYNTRHPLMLVTAWHKAGKGTKWGTDIPRGRIAWGGSWRLACIRQVHVPTCGRMGSFVFRTDFRRSCGCWHTAREGRVWSRGGKRVALMRNKPPSCMEPKIRE
jgi:hypothetical protein